MRTPSDVPPCADSKPIHTPEDGDVTLQQQQQLHGPTTLPSPAKPKTTLSTAASNLAVTTMGQHCHSAADRADDVVASSIKLLQPYAVAGGNVDESSCSSTTETIQMPPATAATTPTAMETIKPTTTAAAVTAAAVAPNKNTSTMVQQYAEDSQQQEENKHEVSTAQKVVVNFISQESSSSSSNNNATATNLLSIATEFTGETSNRYATIFLCFPLIYSAR